MSERHRDFPGISGGDGFWYCTECGASVPRSQDRCMEGHPDPARNTKPPILSFIASNVTAGGGLTEEEFFAAMGSVMRYAPEPSPIIVSQQLLERALEDAERLEREAEEAWTARLTTRRWRFLKRYRLAREEAEKLRLALSLRRTFGSRA